MITSKITYLGGLRTEAVHVRSGVKVITDAPPDNHGKGEAFSPTDTAATSLGTCMLTIMGIAAETHGYNIDGTEVEITKVMADNPRRIGEIIVDITFPPFPYTEAHKRVLEHITRTCPVAFSLHQDLKQTVNITYK
jgi:putative redox protein